MTRLFAGTPFDRPPTCERCGLLESECACPPPAPEKVPPEKQILKVAVERRKNGKVITAVRGLSVVGDAHFEVLTRLKTLCGAGGTFKDDVLEIQGAHLDRVRDALRQWGYRLQK